MKIFTSLMLQLFTVFILHAQDTNRFTSYTQSKFDGFDCCWRQLSKEKRYYEAGLMIREYLEMSPYVKNRESLNWHAGQMFAMADSYVIARKYFKKTYNIFYLWFGGEDGKTWYYYASGTVAFIDRDKSKLERVVKKWEKKYAKDVNYQVLLKLKEKWDLSYKDALGE